jgi:hypothetical protein
VQSCLSGLGGAGKGLVRGARSVGGKVAAKLATREGLATKALAGKKLATDADPNSLVSTNNPALLRAAIEVDKSEVDDETWAAMCDAFVELQAVPKVAALLRGSGDVAKKVQRVNAMLGLAAEPVATPGPAQSPELPAEYVEPVEATLPSKPGKGAGRSQRSLARAEFAPTGAEDQGSNVRAPAAKARAANVAIVAPPPPESDDESDENL